MIIYLNDFSACRHILGHEEESVLRKIKIKIALKTKIKIGSGSNAHDSSSVHMANLRSSASNRPTDGWQCFSLQYSVSWPLHLVITPSVIDKYNEILKFLLYVRRTQCKLHETWANQKKIEVIFSEISVYFSRIKIMGLNDQVLFMLYSFIFL